MTVHWLDKETREKKSGVLPCLRAERARTYDVVAGAIEMIHIEFGIEKKVVMTTTDNARNFAKAFSQFGETENLLHESLAPKCNEIGIADAEDAAVESLLVQNEDDKCPSTSEEVEFLFLFEMGDQEEVNNIMLPAHMRRRRAVHTWILIAIKDSEKAANNVAFRRVYGAALAKVKSLWNYQNHQSTITADSLYKELIVSKRLVVLNDTRWNSMHDAIVSLSKITEDKNVGLR
ncbi:unnamed protein product [Anisakis simplex]|uniref:Dimer_Tnp_hAT domain-containing protein n=1 Tax=Anisakis simplex TaxID=6269 RepID=A0A0M3JQV5_ANISI|nr:unnamed protein product [Anisakis simplex]